MARADRSDPIFLQGNEGLDQDNGSDPISPLPGHWGCYS